MLFVFVGGFTHAIQAEILETEALLGAAALEKQKLGGSVGKHRPSALRVLLGGSSRCWAARGLCHTQMTGKHASRFCAVFALDLFELGTDVDEECVSCELFQQIKTVHREV